ncbi:MAG: putative sulfate exporter family transporter [Gammaproteobacteria bacterium]|nr:putative sulfate exporter family transporter [Gammaproteobacteria bacterium]
MTYFLLAIFIGVSLVINQAAISLILGILFSVIKNRYSLSAVNVNGTNFLKAGIVLLGGTISLSSVSEISVNYLPLVSFYVLMVFLVGFLLGRILKVSQKHLILLVAGTAICGGTAIASLAPIIKAKTEELISSISLVFLLNLLAIIFFPLLGQYMGMSEKDFGIFAALTIHDTASVLGAASIYGEESVVYASVIKLGRTLWIIPMILSFSLYFKNKDPEYNFPYFIIFFLAFVLLGTFVDLNQDIQIMIKKISNALFLLGLFFIGSQFNLKIISELSIKPIIFSITLWLIIIIATLLIFYV